MQIYATLQENIRRKEGEVCVNKKIAGTATEGSAAVSSKSSKSGRRKHKKNEDDSMVSPKQARPVTRHASPAFGARICATVGEAVSIPRDDCCSCLTLLPITICGLLNKIYKPFFTSKHYCHSCCAPSLGVECDKQALLRALLRAKRAV